MTKKKKIKTPELQEFLEDAIMLYESRNLELGHVIMISRDGTKIFNMNTWRWLTPYIHNGYYTVDLKTRSSGKFEPYYVHRLVARVFCWQKIMMCDVRIPWEQLAVHHINGNKLDNRPENLEILTRSFHGGVRNREIKLFTPEGVTIEPGVYCFDINEQKELILVPEQERQQVIIIQEGESRLVL